MEAYEILLSLVKLANENRNNVYSVTDYAFGFIPFKNGENKIQEVGDDFFKIAHWLLNEAEANFKHM